MAQEIEIREPGGRLVGSIIFSQNPDRLHAYRTANGFNLSLPIEIRFVPVGESDPMPMLSNFRGIVFVPGWANQKIEIGRLVYDSWHTGWRGTGAADGIQAQMTWLGSFADLSFYEKFRDGGAVQFDIQFEGELCYLFSMVQTHHMLRTEPQRVRANAGFVTVTYPKEVWVKVLRSLGCAENVLVEVPLPNTPSPEWNEVWKALIEARNAFEQGGSTGWKGCVTAVRLALEKWQGIEKEQMGAGWSRPKQNELEGRSKRERLDNLRWHLMQIAHLGAHTGAEEWSRDDALLMLSVLSVLLAERKP